MLTLAIDTAQDACSVALLEGADIVAERHKVLARGHAEQLVPMIADLLHGAADVSVARIAVDIGPGSFTGLRVGLAAARALGVAWQVPVLGYSALRLAAAHFFQAHAQTDMIWVMLDAGRGQLYVARAMRDGSVGALANIGPAQAAARVQAGDHVVGNGVALVQPFVPDRVRFSDTQAAPASAVRFLQPADFNPTLTPLYVRGEALAAS